MPCASAMAAKNARASAAQATTAPSKVRAASADSASAAAFKDEDSELDLDGFRQLVRAREPGNKQTDAELAKRFTELDADGSGTVDVHEYEGGLILDALGKKTDPFKLFQEADVDGNHTIDRGEFTAALRALGLVDAAVSDASISIVFDALDDDGSGEIDWKELKLKLAPNAIGARKPILGKLCAGRRSKSLGSLTRLSATSDLTVQQQLTELLRKNMSRVIDLFRDCESVFAKSHVFETAHAACYPNLLHPSPSLTSPLSPRFRCPFPFSGDTDGDGTVSCLEFRKAIKALGHAAPADEVDALFNFFDKDGSGKLEFRELHRALRVNAAQMPSAPKKGPSPEEEAAAAAAHAEAMAEAEAEYAAAPEEVKVIDMLEEQLKRSEEARISAVSLQAASALEVVRLVGLLDIASAERATGVRQLAAISRQLALDRAKFAKERSELNAKIASLQGDVERLEKARAKEESEDRVRQLIEERRVLKSQLQLLTEGMFGGGMSGGGGGGGRGGGGGGGGGAHHSPYGAPSVPKDPSTGLTSTNGVQSSPQQPSNPRQANGGGMPGPSPGAWLSASLNGAHPNYAASAWRDWRNEGGHLSPDGHLMSKSSPAGRDFSPSQGRPPPSSSGKKSRAGELRDSPLSRSSSANPSPLGMRMMRSSSGGDLFQASDAGSWISNSNVSVGSDVDALRREKHEERVRAKEERDAKIAAENAEYERRKKNTGACAVVKLSDEVEAKRAAKAAESAADKEAKMKALKSENAQMKRRLEAAGAAVDHTPMFSREAIDLSKPPPRHMLKRTVFQQPEWVGTHTFGP